MRKEDFENKFEKLKIELETMSKKVESLVPKAIIKEATVFGNSSHVVLSRTFLNKKIGVIVFSENETMKGGVL